MPASLPAISPCKVAGKLKTSNCSSRGKELAPTLSLSLPLLSPVSLGLPTCLSRSRGCGGEQRMGHVGTGKILLVPPCLVRNRVEGGMERVETFQLIFLFAFQMKNPALQREMGNRPARRDAPGFDSRLGALPVHGGRALLSPPRRGPSHKRVCRGARRWCRGGGGRTAEPLTSLQPRVLQQSILTCKLSASEVALGIGESSTRGKHPSPPSFLDFRTFHISTDSSKEPSRAVSAPRTAPVPTGSTNQP